MNRVTKIYQCAEKSLAYFGVKKGANKKNGSDVDSPDILFEIDPNFNRELPKKKILVAVAVHNRVNVSKICLDNLAELVAPMHRLVIYDDASTSFPDGFLEKYTTEVVRFPVNLGVGYSRYCALQDFLFRYSDFDLLYLTDNDTFHDYRALTLLSHIFYLQDQLTPSPRPVGLYNSKFHESARIAKNSTIGLYLTCPGVSMCLTREMAKTMFSGLLKSPQLINSSWDFTWPPFLGKNFIIPSHSYVEHFARDREQSGLHSNNSGLEYYSAQADFDRDRALNPTNFLVSKRDDIIKKILHYSPQK